MFLLFTHISYEPHTYTISPLQVALKNVVSRGAAGPYEQHLLTRLMQDAIGGNARTIMVATIDMANAEVQ